VPIDITALAQIALFWPNLPRSAQQMTPLLESFTENRQYVL